LQSFSLPVSVWQVSFSPHALHGAMLKRQSCECESAWKLPRKAHAPKKQRRKNKQPFDPPE
jgi:hypothetical protein